MEVAYLDQHRREYEITKHVSVSQLDPLALMQLRQTGSCEFTIPEALFDLDYAGHYLRRLKSVSITIPCVTGPYTGVNCTLTLLKSSVRHTNAVNGSYARDMENEDARFTDSFGAIQSIVTSSAQNDSGLFETNLRDERYLPFEGAGAISEWRIELPSDFRSFDYDTISDVVMHLRYTARDSGAPLKQKAAIEMRESVNAFVRNEGQQGLARLFSLRHEFPSEWHRFLNPPAATGGGENKLTIDLGRERFPFIFQGKGIGIRAIDALVKIKPEFSRTYNDSTIQLSISPENAASTPTDKIENWEKWNGMLRGGCTFGSLPGPGNWALTGGGDGTTRLDPNAIENIVLLCSYQLQ